MAQRYQSVDEVPKQLLFTHYDSALQGPWLHVPRTKAAFTYLMSSTLNVLGLPPPGLIHLARELPEVRQMERIDGVFSRTSHLVSSKMSIHLHRPNLN